MAAGQRTIKDAVDLLQIKDAGNAQQVFTTAGIKPEDLSHASVGKEYIMLGISPEDFLKHHGGQAFSFKDLIADFKKICTDYDKSLTYSTPSKAVEFCSKVIYEIGPESRKVTKNSDKTWVFKFPYSSEGKLVVKTAFVSTYKGEGVEYKKIATDTKICMTVKQAGLLAIRTFSLIAALAVKQSPSVILMTPLAGAVFSKDDLPKLADELGLTVEKAVIMVNNSCQSGSHYLPDSKMYCAAVAAITATKNLKTEGMRDSIVGKVLKQYRSAGRTWNADKFYICSKFATGGLPLELQPEVLIKTYEEAQFKKIDQLRAVHSSVSVSKT